jgi:hypothetical protein
MNENEIKILAELLNTVQLPNHFEIDGTVFRVEKGHNLLINNQGQKQVVNTNFVQANHEYTIYSEGLVLPISIQFYLNEDNFYRVFLFAPKGMLFSINFSDLKYITRNTVHLNQLIKITTSNKTSTSAQRAYGVSGILTLLQKEKMLIDGKTVLLGKYDFKNNKFIDTTAEKFIFDFVKVGIIKGHFMGNKNYSIPNFEK